MRRWLWRRGPKRAYILRLVGLGVAIFLCLLGAEHLRQALGGLRWPKTEGHVLAIDTTTVSRGGDAGTPLHAPVVRYEYLVYGVVHQSTVWRPGGGPPTEDTFGSAEAAREAGLAYWPVGTSLTVIYDPRNPAVSLIEPGVSPTSLIALLLGLGMAGGVIWGGLRRAPRR